MYYQLILHMILSWCIWKLFMTGNDKDIFDILNRVYLINTTFSNIFVTHNKYFWLNKNSIYMDDISGTVHNFGI